MRQRTERKIVQSQTFSEYSSGNCIERSCLLRKVAYPSVQLRRSYIRGPSDLYIHTFRSTVGPRSVRPIHSYIWVHGGAALCQTYTYIHLGARWGRALSALIRGQPSGAEGRLSATRAAALRRVSLLVLLSSVTEGRYLLTYKCAYNAVPWAEDTRNLFAQKIVILSFSTCSFQMYDTSLLQRNRTPSWKQECVNYRVAR